MSCTTRCLSVVLIAGISLAPLGAFSSAAYAAFISYPDVGPIPPGVTFLEIKESSGTDPLPLYGPPTGFPIGLSFNPTSFSTSSAGSGADITDGQLNFTVMSAAGINTVSLFESGNYSLSGTGSSTTQVAAGANLTATVTHINGSAVAPIVLVPSNASVNFNLLANSGIGLPWSVGVLVDINSQLAGLGFGPDQLATKVSVVIDNSLLAISEPNSTAYLAKNRFDIEIVPGEVIPEPSTIALAGLALCGLRLVSARRRG